MTPRNVLMIGNSHTVAPRMALRDRGGEWSGIGFDVFAMPPSSLHRVALRDYALFPLSERAAEHMARFNQMPNLPLAGYDGFVVVGGLAFSAVSQLQDRHRSLDFPSVADGQPCNLISTGYMDAMIRHRIKASAAIRLVRMLTELQQGPVLLVDTVLPSADCREDAGDLLHHVDMAARADGAAFHVRYLRILADVIGDAARIVLQPPQTIVDQVFTAPEYMRGSYQLWAKGDRLHDEREYRHANPAYGALLMDAVTDALR